MTLSSDEPSSGGDVDPVVVEPVIEPAVTEHVSTSTTESSESQTVSPSTASAGGGTSPTSGGGKLKIAAVVATAAALANKMRQEAPKKVQELREKRVAGRCVIITDVAGQSMAIGPYRDEASARSDSLKVVGATPVVVELVAPTAHFGRDSSESPVA